MGWVGSQSETALEREEGKMTLAALGEDMAQEKALRAEGKEFKNFQLFNLLSQKLIFVVPKLHTVNRYLNMSNQPLHRLGDVR